jgi:DNA-binding NtrC family response regulator
MSDSEAERHLEQLVSLAQALATEIKTLRAELDADQKHDGEPIDFYDAVECYEIELIRTALNRCDGNQSQAARLLHLKSTTLHAKMKHYGLNGMRSLMLQQQNSSEK